MAKDQEKAPIDDKSCLEITKQYTQGNRSLISREEAIKLQQEQREQEKVEAAQTPSALMLSSAREDLAKAPGKLVMEWS